MTPPKTDILIVDDNPETLQLLNLGLSRAGYAVHTANSLVQVEALLEKNAARFEPFDVVLLDLMLPDHDGFQIFETLKASLYPQPAVIVLSAKNTLADAVRASDLGAKRFLVKPISLQKLTQVIEEVRAGAR